MDNIINCEKYYVGCFTINSFDDKALIWMLTYFKKKCMAVHLKNVNITVYTIRNDLKIVILFK